MAWKFVCQKAIQFQRGHVWLLLTVKKHYNRDLAVIDLRIPKQLIVEPNIPVRGKGSKT